MNKEHSDNFFSKPLVVCMGALIACILWGSAFPSIKIGYATFNISSSDTFSQLLFAGIRFFLAGILIIAYASISNKGLLKLSKNQTKKVFKLSCLQTIMQYVFFYMGLANASGSNSSIITAAGAFLTIILSSICFKTDKITIQKLIGCIVGFVGVLFIIIPSAKLSGIVNLKGEGFILISTLSGAYSAIMIKNYSKEINPVFLCGYQFLFGGLIIILASLALGGHISNWSLNGIAVLLYLAFLSAIAYTLWTVLIKHNPVSHVSVFQFTVPIFGVILSSLFLANENINKFTIIALTLVSLGIILVNKSKK